jgi:hypothetical protein
MNGKVTTTIKSEMVVSNNQLSQKLKLLGESHINGFMDATIQI